jgi:hypothetical protein
MAIVAGHFEVDHCLTTRSCPIRRDETFAVVHWSAHDNTTFSGEFSQRRKKRKLSDPKTKGKNLMELV